MTFEQQRDNMLKMANEIADRLEGEADKFRDLPGDVALREFAKAIRKINEQMAAYSPIN